MKIIFFLGGKGQNMGIENMTWKVIIFFYRRISITLLFVFSDFAVLKYFNNIQK